MEPRLKSSKKWTAFPSEYVEQIAQVFQEGFKDQLKDSKLLIEGRIYSEEILLRVGFLEKGRLAQTNFEISMNYSAKDQDAVERIHDCIDAAGSMMAEYFEQDGEVDFPRQWKEYEFNRKKLYLQYTTENSDLEAQANALLGESEGSLVQGNDDEAAFEDALDRAEEQIQTDDDDGVEYETEEDEDGEEAPSGPTMFSGKGKKKKEDLH